MIPELVFWSVIFFFGMLAFRHWATNVAPRKDWEADTRALTETQRFATHKNRDVTYADFEYQGFALDGDSAA